MDFDFAVLPQTALAIENFALDYHPVKWQLVRAVIVVKKAAALTYADLAREARDAAREKKHRAVAAAADQLLADATAAKFFPVDALQGGAGTSTNMNVNEALAYFAAEILGEKVHPLDDVNRGQSTNDVYPTALRVAAILELRQLSDECAALQETLQRRENEFAGIKKLGRTELMDAVPITLGDEFGAYAQAVARDRWRLYKIEERLRQVNFGGTAVGGGDNAERQYRFRGLEKLRELTGIGLAAAEYPLDLTQNNDVFVEVSGLLKALSVNLLKIANDLRLMNSGPRGGLGEIKLAAMQMGSTLMPGKVNPVIAEMTMQAAMKVIANDAAITAAAAHGEFELNAFLPLIADALLESLALLRRAVPLFRDRCVALLAADRDRCREWLENSFAFAAAFVPLLGYDRVAQIVKENPPDAARTLMEELRIKNYVP
ncbi:MAG: aspartate ammonia-lyase [Planctomycetota bacterium]|jgi:aspartate ammonia-lyase|nr:aspartate ammonia-lyase [Planctomycetota bacterium]